VNPPVPNFRLWASNHKESHIIINAVLKIMYYRESCQRTATPRGFNGFAEGAFATSSHTCRVPIRATPPGPRPRASRATPPVPHGNGRGRRRRGRSRYAGNSKVTPRQYRVPVSAIRLNQVRTRSKDAALAGRGTDRTPRQPTATRELTVVFEVGRLLRGYPGARLLDLSHKC
jgi:hypothetical protein